jgi:hypothetical protein
MNIQLTTAQRLQQELINGFITDLEKQIQQGGAGAAVNADLGTALNGLLATFDKNKDAKFNANELTGLTGHLRAVNTDQNIAQLFTKDGQVNFATASKIDITGDGTFNGQEDLVALQQIIGSRTSLTQAVAQTSTLANNGQIKSGTGNVPGGLNNFNSRGAYFVTADGSTILTDVNVGGHETRIHDNTGKMITKIWGDPHVGDDKNVAAGWDWHFGNDSTFILQDGTEIMFNTEGNENNNIYATTGLYIKSGNDVYQTGQSFGTSKTGVASSSGARNSGISKLEISATEFDAQYADAANDRNGAGVFAYSAQANSGRGGWAVMTNGGVFQDVQNEAWGVYLQAGKASFNGQYDGQVSVNKAQMIAALDGDAVRSFRSLSNSPAGSQIVPGSNPPIKADDLFLNYYFKEGADAKELKAFSDMILNGSSAEKLSVLDDYIRNGAEIPLTDAQESKFLNYLITPATSGIAKTYLALIEDQADPQKFEILDRLARGEYILNASQQDTFFDFLLDFQNAKLAENYAGIIQKGADQTNIKYLEDYAAGKLQVTLNTDQENKMLDYLGNSKNSNIAKSYVNFVKNGATDKDYATLDEIFQKSGSINQVVAPTDFKFLTNLESLKNEFRINIDPRQILRNLSDTTFSDLNDITGNMITYISGSDDARQAKTNTTSLVNDLLGVLINPVKNLISTYQDESATVSVKILELQLKALNELDPNNPSIIKAKEFATNKLNSIPGYLKNEDPLTKGLSTDTKRDYALFASAFPPGQPPTAAQSAAALELITGNYILGDNPAFITNYAKFVRSGDTRSAETLIEIAHYFGSDKDYRSSLGRFSNANLDAKGVATAAEILSFSKSLEASNAQDFRGGVLVANRFLLDTVLNNKGGFDAATEGDLTKTFFQSLKETLTNKSSTVTNGEYDDFIRNSVFGLSGELYNNGQVTRTSLVTSLPKNISRGFLGSLAKDGIAQMQIDVFEGMLGFYQGQIQQENAKPEPNTSKISQWQTQINAHRTAITALQGTLS